MEDDEDRGKNLELKRYSIINNNKVEAIDYIFDCECT